MQNAQIATANVTSKTLKHHR